MPDIVSPGRALQKAQVAAMPAPTFSPSMIEQLNEEFAVALAGGKAVIIREDPGAEPGHKVEFMSRDSFLLWTQNRQVYYDGKQVPIGQIWLKSALRRTYRGVVFDPGGKGRDGHYNLWRGWSVEPSPDGDASPFFELIHDVICGGDGELSAWVTGWFAQIVQHPAKKPGTALVLRGGQGAGKTMVGEIFGWLMPDHYILVDDPRYLVHNFNAHMASCLLLQADEGFWAGDKQAEGRLKGLITSEYQMIEAKGVDPVRMRNHVRLFITSNEDWVVPAGMRERRFCVIDVPPVRQQDRLYFGRLRSHMSKPENLAALLWELQHFNLDAVDVSRIPRTQALLDQIVDAMDSFVAWWMQCLDIGGVPGKCEEWPEFIPTRWLYESYYQSWERRRIGKPLLERSFGKRFRAMCPSARRERRLPPDEAVSDRKWGYVLPPLAVARREFEEVVGQSVDWLDDV